MEGIRSFADTRVDVCLAPIADLPAPAPERDRRIIADASTGRTASLSWL